VREKQRLPCEVGCFVLSGLPAKWRGEFLRPLYEDGLGILLFGEGKGEGDLRPYHATGKEQGCAHTQNNVAQAERRT